MASINGILRINDQGNGVIESFTSSIASNNLSQKPFTTNVLSFLNGLTRDNDLYSGASGTPIGNTTIENLRFGVQVSGGSRTQTYKGLDFGYTNSNGVLNLTLTIVGTDAISFKIRFDRSRNQYPTDYTWYDIDNVAHTITGNTSNELTFQQRAGYGTTTIVFSQWALANTSVGLTFIESVELDLYLDKLQIMNFESQTQLTSDVRSLQYGALANTGKIELKDVDNRILENAKLGYLNTYIFSLSLYANERLFARHITNQSPYFNGDKTIQLQLTNDIDKWNQIEIPENTFSNQTTLYQVLKYVLLSYDSELLDSEIETMTNKPIVYSRYTGGIQTNYLETVQEYLTNIIVATANSPLTLKKDTMANQIKKICTVAQLCCYTTYNNKIKFDSIRPKISSNWITIRNAMAIGYSEEVSNIDYDILVNNRYDDVEFS